MKRVTLTRPLRKSPAYVKSKESGVPTSPLPPPYRGGEGRGVPLEVLVKEEKNKVGSLLDQASELSATDRKLLLAKLSLGLHHSRSDDPRDLDMWVAAVYEGLQTAFGAGDGAGVGPAAVKRTLGSPACWGPVAEFMGFSKLDQLKVAERQSVYQLLAGLVIKHARYVSSHSGAPMSAKLVGSVSVNIAGIFDQAFPGYLASGLAKMVATRLVRQREVA